MKTLTLSVLAPLFFVATAGATEKLAVSDYTCKSKDGAIQANFITGNEPSFTVDLIHVYQQAGMQELYDVEDAATATVSADQKVISATVPVQGHGDYKFEITSEGCSEANENTIDDTPDVGTAYSKTTN